MRNSAGGNRTTLSIAMIVRDAEAKVADTLESIRSIADEIVVADTGSNDGTRAIVESFATTVIDVAWQDDFSAARNVCLAATTGQWVFWLDAGETLTEQAAKDLRSFVDLHADPATVYALTVCLPRAEGGFAGLQVARQRLMPKHEGLQFEGAIRESLEVAIKACEFRGESLDLVIQRHSSDHQTEVKLQKAHRNLRICDTVLVDQPHAVRRLLARAEALAVLGEFEQARHNFQQARRNAENGSNEMLESYYGELTSYDGDSSARDAQLDMCIEALETYPVDIQLLCAMGSYLQSLQRIDLAARAYQTAVRYGQVNPAIWHLADIADIAATCLSVALELQDRDDEATVILEDALADRPDSERVRHQLIDLHIRHGRRKAAIEQAVCLPAKWPHREAFINAVRGAGLAKQQEWVAAQAYLETAFEAGCRDVLCLRWLTLAFSALDKLDDALLTLDEWRKVEPASEEIKKIADGIGARKAAGEATRSEETGCTEAVPPDAAERRFHIHRPGDAAELTPPRPKYEATRQDLPQHQPPRTS